MQKIRNADDLLKADLIEESLAASIKDLSKTYSIGITPEVSETIRKASNTDPVYKQYVPDIRELNHGEIERDDPIGDDVHEVTKGLIHRYSDRVLFKITPNCAVYCRFCFRREMVGRGKDALTENDLLKIYDYIQSTKNIREVILSGGDPLILSPRRLSEVIARLEKIDHVKIIRIHTRIPIANPCSVTDELCQALKTTKKIVFVLHTNHAQELTDRVEAALDKLSGVGTLLSQSVLLGQINDDPDTLLRLFEELGNMGVKPYYLHHPDKANGTKHFRVSIKKGMDIYAALCGKISGYLRPSYVLDIPGGFGKVPVNSDWIVPHVDGGYTVKDIHGDKHRYYD